MNVLLVNDDGVECALFLSLLRECKKIPWISKLSAVVPAFEKSWIGSAITRDALLRCEEREVEGVKVFIVDGTPADCVSISFSGLFPSRPDLIISGLNVGRNSSVAFSNGSGTLNAAKFGALHGVPSVAFSMQASNEIKNAWNSRDDKVLSTFENLFDGVNKYLLKATKALLDSGLLIGEKAVAHYCSFNSSHVLDSSLEPVLCTPLNNRFAPLFVEVEPRVFKHKFNGFDENFKETLEYKPVLPDDEKIVFSGRVAYSLFRVDYDYGLLNLPTDCSGRMSEAWSAL